MKPTPPFVMSRYSVDRQTDRQTDNFI